MALSRPSLDGWRGRAAAYASLVRVPNLFTAPPDVLLGATLVTGGVAAAPREVAGLALASVLLYAAGTILNDAFDAPVDARERPERPIPSGEVTRRAAFAAGAGLLFLGVVVALLTVGPTAGGVSALLAVGVLLYDGVLKGSSAGFLAMGAVRGINVLLGTTAAGSLPAGAAVPAVAVPVVVAAYIAAVTYMAAREREGENRTAIRVAAGGVTLGALAVAGTVWWVRPDLVAAVLAIGLGTAFLWWTGRPLRRAFVDPTPERVGAAVGACVLGLVLLDAALAAAIDPASGSLGAAFLLPAVLLSRPFDVT